MVAYASCQDRCHILITNPQYLTLVLGRDLRNQFEPTLTDTGIFLNF